VNPSASTPPGETASSAAELERLEHAVEALQNQRVEDWVRLVRHGSVIPLSVEKSLSWRITRPVRLGQTAVDVLRRDGANRFISTARVRLRRLLSRR